MPINYTVPDDQSYDEIVEVEEDYSEDKELASAVVDSRRGYIVRCCQFISCSGQRIASSSSAASTRRATRTSRRPTRTIILTQPPKKTTPARRKQNKKIQPVYLWRVPVKVVTPSAPRVIYYVTPARPRFVVLVSSPQPKVVKAAVAPKPRVVAPQPRVIVVVSSPQPRVVVYVTMPQVPTLRFNLGSTSQNGIQYRSNNVFLDMLLQLDVIRYSPSKGTTTHSRSKVTHNTDVKKNSVTGLVMTTTVKSDSGPKVTNAVVTTRAVVVVTTTLATIVKTAAPPIETTRTTKAESEETSAPPVSVDISVPVEDTTAAATDAPAPPADTTAAPAEVPTEAPLDIPTDFSARLIQVSDDEVEYLDDPSPVKIFYSNKTPVKSLKLLSDDELSLPSTSLTSAVQIAPFKISVTKTTAKLPTTKQNQISKNLAPTTRMPLTSPVIKNQNALKLTSVSDRQTANNRNTAGKMKNTELLTTKNNQVISTKNYVSVKDSYKTVKLQTNSSSIISVKEITLQVNKTNVSLSNTNVSKPTTIRRDEIHNITNLGRNTSDEASKVIATSSFPPANFSVKIVDNSTVNNTNLMPNIQQINDNATETLTTMISSNISLNILNATERTINESTYTLTTHANFNKMTLNVKNSSTTKSPKPPKIKEQNSLKLTSMSSKAKTHNTTERMKNNIELTTIKNHQITPTKNYSTVKDSHKNVNLQANSSSTISVQINNTNVSLTNTKTNTKSEQNHNTANVSRNTTSNFSTAITSAQASKTVSNSSFSPSNFSLKIGNNLTINNTNSVSTIQNFIDNVTYNIIKTLLTTISSDVNIDISNITEVSMSESSDGKFNQITLNGQDPSTTGDNDEKLVQVHGQNKVTITYAPSNTTDNDANTTEILVPEVKSEQTVVTISEESIKTDQKVDKTEITDEETSAEQLNQSSVSTKTNLNSKDGDVTTISSGDYEDIAQLLKKSFQSNVSLNLDDIDILNDSLPVKVEQSSSEISKVNISLVEETET